MINLFKNNVGFNHSIFGGNDIPNEIKDNLIQVEDSVYADLLAHKLMWQNGSLVSNPNYAKYAAEQEAEKQKETYRQELTEIKFWFTENDWKVNKIVIGEWLENDPRWLEYKQERTVKRARQDKLLELLK